MIQDALIVTVVYLISQWVDTVLGWQACSRPIIMGTITGLALGNIQTGIIMGAALESLNMGISGIGGTVPSDFTTSSVIAVAFTLMTGADMESAIAISIPVGTVMATAYTVTGAFSVTLQPIYEKLIDKGEFRKYELACFGYMFIFQRLLNATVLFVALAFGIEQLNNLFAVLPPFVLTGFSTAGGMMAVVGLALLATSVWSKETGIYIILGFILAKYLGLSTIVIAAIALVIAYVSFFNEKNIHDLSLTTVTRNNMEGDDDFYD